MFKQFQSTLPTDYSRFTIFWLFILKMHFRYSFICLHFSHYQELLQFLHYVSTVTDQEKLSNFQEKLSLQGAAYNFSSVSATSSHTSVKLQILSNF